VPVAVERVNPASARTAPAGPACAAGSPQDAQPSARARAARAGIAPLRLGGLTPLTTLDYPGELAAVLFCQGCPWRCRYCHNGHLLDAEPPADAPRWDAVLAWLSRRRGLLDAVVFSGGEPTAQAALADAIDQVRAMGFRIGLHSGGAYPQRLARVLDRVDWIGLDIKALPEDYPGLTGVEGSGLPAWDSLDLVLASGVAHQVRVTVHPALLPPGRLALLLERLRRHGVADPVLQDCRTGQVLDPKLGRAATTADPEPG
jgi:pyruvate formate lyase activating enzyme